MRTHTVREQRERGREGGAPVGCVVACLIYARRCCSCCCRRSGVYYCGNIWGRAFVVLVQAFAVIVVAIVNLFVQIFLCQRF